MSVDLSYIVKRDREITFEEKKIINKIIEKYRIEDLKEVDWNGDNIEVPQYEIYEAPIILEGSIEIGYYEDDYEREIEEVVRWCYCLTEISNNIIGAEWKVRLGDELLLFDSEIGFYLKRLPKVLYQDLKIKSIAH